jgi:tellurite resistance protein
MFLNVLNEQEQTAFMQLAHLVAIADGYIDEKESQMMTLYKQEIGKIGDIAFEEASLQDLITLFTTEESKNAAFIEILSLIMSDGVYSDEERAIAKDITIGFGFTQQKYERCKEWVRKISDTYQEGLSIVYG